MNVLLFKKKRNNHVHIRLLMYAILEKKQNFEATVRPLRENGNWGNKTTIALSDIFHPRLEYIKSLQNGHSKGVPTDLYIIAKVLLSVGKEICPSKNKVKHDKRAEENFARVSNGLEAQVTSPGLPDKTFISKKRKEVARMTQNMVVNSAGKIEEDTKLTKAKEEYQKILGVDEIFVTKMRILEYVQNKGVEVSQNHFYNMMQADIKKCFMPNHGRKPILSVQKEEELLSVVSARILEGQMLTAKDVQALAMGLEADVSDSWVKRFLYYTVPANNANIIKATQKGLQSGKVKHFNSNNVKWWISVTLEALKRDNFIVEENGKLVWKDLSRVMHFDETGISSQKQPKTKKVVVVNKATADDHNFSGQMEIKDYAKHITLVAGTNFLCHPIMPLWIVARDNEFTEVEENELKQCLFHSKQFGDLNGVQYKRKMLKTSKSGSITPEILAEYVEQLIDILNKGSSKGKPEPILFFCDWHSSRLDPVVSQALEKGNATMVFWLPNSTSVQQPMDISCFAPFESAFGKAKRDLKEIIANNEQNTKEGLTLQDTLSCANVALEKIYRNHNIALVGLKKSGILNLDFEELLAHPEIHAGDSYKKKTDHKIAFSRVKEMCTLIKTKNGAVKPSEYVKFLATKFGQGDGFPLGTQNKFMLNEEPVEDIKRETILKVEENQMANMEKLKIVIDTLNTQSHMVELFRGLIEKGIYNESVNRMDGATHHFIATSLPEMLSTYIEAVKEFDKSISYTNLTKSTKNLHPGNLLQSAGPFVSNVVKRKLVIREERQENKNKKVKEKHPTSHLHDSSSIEGMQFSDMNNIDQNPISGAESYILGFGSFNEFEKHMQSNNNSPSHSEFVELVNSRLKDCKAIRIIDKYNIMLQKAEMEPKIDFYKSLYRQVHMEKKKFTI